MTTIDGSTVQGITIDGTKVKEVTIDGNVAWKAETIIDSFEDADIAEYQGDTASFNVTTNNSPTDGSYRLERGADGYAQIESLSGLNAYPSQGDEFRCDFFTGDGTGSASYTAFLWAVQSSSNFYYARAEPQTGDFELHLNGTTYSTTVSLSYSTWYEYKVQWDDGATFGGNAGDHTVELLDSSGTNIATLTGNDTSWSSGGIGFGVAESPAGADYVRITN